MLKASSPIRAVENIELEDGSDVAPGSFAWTVLLSCATRAWSLPAPHCSCATAVSVSGLAPLWSWAASWPSGLGWPHLCVPGGWSPHSWPALETLGALPARTQPGPDPQLWPAWPACSGGPGPAVAAGRRYGLCWAAVQPGWMHSGSKVTDTHQHRDRCGAQPPSRLPAR